MAFVTFAGVRKGRRVRARHHGQRDFYRMLSYHSRFLHIVYTTFVIFGCHLHLGLCAFPFRLLSAPFPFTSRPLACRPLLVPCASMQTRCRLQSRDRTFDTSRLAAAVRLCFWVAMRGHASAGSRPQTLETGIAAKSKTDAQSLVSSALRRYCGCTSHADSPASPPLTSSLVTRAHR